MGKTALATNIAFNAARRARVEHRRGRQGTTVDGAVVGFFSLEMSAEQLATRILSEQSGSRRTGSGAAMITTTSSTASSTPASELAAPAALHRRHAGAHRSARCAPARAGSSASTASALIVIDYLQLIAPDRARATTTGCRRSPRSPAA